MKDVLEQLKMVRLSRGWTLQDVSDRTRINITVLKALESGNTGDLGSPLTVEALLRKYSTALESQTEPAEDRLKQAAGRDVAGIGKTLRRITAGLIISAVFAAVCLGIVFWKISDTVDSHVKSRPPAVSRLSAIASATAKRKLKEMGTGHREPLKTEKKSPALSPPHVAAGPVPASKQAAVSPGVFHGAAAVPDRSAAVASKQPAALVPNQPGSVASKGPPVTVQPPHSLEMAADQRTWIQVVIDDKKTETELLQPGQIQQWLARNKVDLVVGNGGGVHILWDGKPVKISRTPGRVVRLTLPEPDPKKEIE